MLFRSHERIANTTTNINTDANDDDQQAIHVPRSSAVQRYLVHGDRHRLVHDVAHLTEDAVDLLLELGDAGREGGDLGLVGGLLGEQLVAWLLGLLLGADLLVERIELAELLAELTALVSPLGIELDHAIDKLAVVVEARRIAINR